MPVRSRGPLLAGLSALLGLWTAGAGCQSSAVSHNAYAIQCSDGSCGGGSTSIAFRAGSSNSSSTASESHRPLFNAPGVRESVVARTCNCDTSTTTALKPIATASASPIGENASSWQPIQPVEAEGSGGTTTSAGYATSPGGQSDPVIVPSNGVEMDPPQPLASPQAPSSYHPQSTIPLVNSGGAIPLPGAVTEGDKDKSVEKPKEEPQKGANVLPAPRSLRTQQGQKPQTQNVPGVNGYPELPQPLVVHAPAVPREFEKRAFSPYIVEPPDILLIVATAAITFENLPISGSHLVRPDGTISLGAYGDLFVAGRTLDDIKFGVAEVLQAKVWKKAPNPKEGTKGERFTTKEILNELQVDVQVYNSKFFYVITDGGGYGEQVFKLPSTGNETVLDALAAIQGLPAQSSKKKIWVARATPYDHNHPPFILPVDWCAIAQRGSAATNYQLFPGDRVYVHSDPLLRLDTRIQRFLSPIERVFGGILLGSATVNSIKNGGSSGGAGGLGGLTR